MAVVFHVEVNKARSTSVQILSGAAVEWDVTYQGSMLCVQNVVWIGFSLKG